VKYLAPWVVTIGGVWLYGAVLWSYYTWLPVRVFDVFLMIGMGVSIAVVIWGYWRIAAIFDRIESRR
jgi:hypothetical protein